MLAIEEVLSRFRPQSDSETYKITDNIIHPQHSIQKVHEM